MVKRVAVAVLAVLFLSAASTAGVSSDCFVAHINAARQTAKVPAVTVDSALTATAQRHAAAMAAQGHIYHSVLPSGVWGENVGVGPSCETVAAAFLASPGHRAVTLNGAYTQVGVGTVETDGLVWVTELFTQTDSQVAPPARVIVMPIMRQATSYWPTVRVAHPTVRNRPSWLRPV